LVTIVDGGVLTCADRAAEMKAQLDPIVADRACMTRLGLRARPSRERLLRRWLWRRSGLYGGAATIKAALANSLANS
jgi:hypothetical protein